MKRFLLLCLLPARLLFGWEDLGTWGTTYEIVEPDLMSEIEIKARDLNKSKILEEAKASLAASMRVERMVPVCRETTVRKYEPIYELQHDIVMPDGTVLYKKGYRFNILAKLREKSGVQAFRKYLLFLDADDPVQRAMARHYAEGAKALVVSGDGMKLVKEGVFAFLADRSMIERFGVRCAPSIYKQEGDRFVIYEYDPEDFKKERQ